MLPDRNATVPIAKPKKKIITDPDEQRVVRARHDKLPDRNKKNAIAVSDKRFKDSVNNARNSPDANPFRDVKVTPYEQSDFATGDEHLRRQRRKLYEQGITPAGNEIDF